MYEHFFDCPYCWEQISILLDPSVSQQSYIEDCEVCCNPLDIQLTFENLELQDFQISSLEQ